MITSSQLAGNAPERSAATVVRQMIDEGGERYWRIQDFSSLPVMAVTQTLSRLAKAGLLQRTSKGVYYHPRLTAFGHSRPAASDVDRATLGSRARPAGRTAANLLGFTTQNAAHGEYATSANTAPSRALAQARIYTRRPESWDRLSDEDAAILDFLRSRGVHSELDDRDTADRLLILLSKPGRFERLAAVAADEPPRVRAMLGAVGRETGVSQNTLEHLRKQINPLTKFDFGRLKVLRYARDWQAR